MKTRFFPLRLLALSLAACFSLDAYATPTGAQVVAGQASFSQQGNVFSITNTPNTIINWQSFSIGAGDITRFIQQSGSSAVLNRITGQDPSRILGTLQSNGRVYLINPNGILFGAGSQVDVNGLVASSLNITNADFLAGKNNFTAGSVAGAVSNQGTISTPSGGQVILIAPTVGNSGIITSPQGEVMLAAGHSVQLADTSNPDLQVVVSAPADQAINLGQIVAAGGKVGIYGALVNQRGTINANSAVLGENGQIVLKASGTTLLEAGSTTTATNTASGATGGTVEVLGQQVGLTGNARIDVSGAGGGGTVLVGGDSQGANAAVPNALSAYVGQDASIVADATGSGNGGKVVVWSDNATRMFGSISAQGGALGGDGGQVETSGHYLDVSDARVNTLAARGKTGSWLLDPYDIDIVASGGNASDLTDVATFGAGSSTGVTSINASVLSSATSNVTLQATDNISFDAAVNITRSGIGLSAQAQNAITVAAPITTNNAAISLLANSSGSNSSGALAINAALVSNGGAITLGGASIAVGSSVSAGSGALTAATNLSGASLTIASGGSLSGGQVSLAADAMSLGGAVSGTSLTLTPISAGQDIALGAASISGSGTLGLSQADINKLHGSALTIAGDSSGDLTVSGATVMPSSFSTVNLTTHGNMAFNAPFSLADSSGYLTTAVFNTSASLTVGSGGSLSAATINLQANKMTLGGAVHASSAVIVQPYLSPVEIDLGANGASDALSLLQSDLSNIATPSLLIASPNGGSINVTGPVNFAQASVTLSGSAINVGASASGSALTLKGDSITLGAPVTASTSATLTSQTSGMAVAIGGDSSAVLDLSASSLNNIVTPQLTVGSSTAGDVSVSSALDLAAGGAQNLSLVSGGAITLGADVTLGHAGGLLSLNAAGDISQTAGSISTSALNAQTAGQGAVSLTDAGNTIGALTAAGTGINVVNSGNMTIGNGSNNGYALLLDGSASALTVTTTGALSINGNVNAGTAPVSLTGASINLGTLAGSAPVVTGAKVTLTANAASSGRLNLANGLIQGGAVVLEADNMTLGSGVAIKALTDLGGTGTGSGYGTVQLTPFSSGVNIALGSGALDNAGTLGLTGTELNTVTASKLLIGDASELGSFAESVRQLGATQYSVVSPQGGPFSGAINVVGALDLSTAGKASAVTLASNGGDIKVGAALSAPQLVLKTSGTITNNATIHSDVLSLIGGQVALASGSGQGIVASTSMSIDSASGASLNLGSVVADALNLSSSGLGSITTPQLLLHSQSTIGINGALNLPADQIGDLVLSSTGDIVQASTASITGPHVMTAMSSGAVDLIAANGVSNISGSAGAGGFTFNTVAKLNVANSGYGNAGIDSEGDIVLSSTSTLGVSQSTGAILTAPVLQVQAVGPINLAEANLVDTLSANVSGSGAGVSFNNFQSFAVGAGTTLSGISTNGGNIKLSSGGSDSSAIALSAPVNAGSGGVTLLADSLSLGALVTGGAVNLAPYSPNLAIIVGNGSDACSSDCLAIGDLSNVVAASISIGSADASNGSGLISVHNIVAASASYSGEAAMLNAATTRLALLSKAGVVETGDTIQVRDLAVASGGDIILAGSANQITNFAASTSSAGGLAFSDATSFSIAHLSDSYLGYGIAGIANPGGSVNLTSGNAILQSSGATISADNLTLSASGGIGSISAPLLTEVSTLSATNTAVAGTAPISISNHLGQPGQLTLNHASQDGTGNGGAIAIDNTGLLLVPEDGTVTTGSGAISLTAHSPLTIDGTVTTGSGNIALTAGATGSDADILTLGSTANVSSNSGNITLTAGGAIIIDSAAQLHTASGQLTQAAQGNAATSPAPPSSPTAPVPPTLAQCTIDPTLSGCTAVLPTLGSCTTNPAQAGCTAVLPTLGSCTTNPAQAGCTAVLPTLGSCTTNPAQAGCTAVLPTLTSCVASPTLAGCVAVLPTLAQCTATPTLTGCLPPVTVTPTSPTSPESPTSPVAPTSPTSPDAPVLGSTTQDQCALTPGLALCQVLTPPTQGDPIKPLTLAGNAVTALTLPNAPGSGGNSPPGGPSSNTDSSGDSAKPNGSGGNSAAPEKNGASNEFVASKTYCN